jgi:imidazole glycerol phosphate synthase glutamine amidotransferase subunit
MGQDVTIVETGVANIASLIAAFDKLGYRAGLTGEPAEIAAAERLVLPGVGAFGAGMAMLEESDLVEPLRERLAAGEPTLCICLGMQLLCESSEESPGVEGLGVVPAKIAKFPSEVRSPQFGWNEVVAGEECRVLRTGYAYFANSYRLAERPDGWDVATTDYGGEFVAAMERGDVVACQFHPEISGEWGLGLLRRWLE